MGDPATTSAAGFLPHEWETVKELFNTCQPMPAGEREPWLRSHCDSPKVRDEVLRLLTSEADSKSFLDRPAVEKALGLTRPLERIGPFRIVKQIGRGGMGVVYEAIDDRLGRRVALKILPPATAGDKDMRQRLLWDARSASSLNHPNIVTIYEIGSDGDLDYVAMECIQGRTLAQILAAERLPVETVVDYALQIATALEAAHAGGIAHRDLKPGNIMVTGDGFVKLLDFGLAKRLMGSWERTDAGATGATRTMGPETVQGSFAGTVAYVSPEMAEGKAADARSDIFSFGSVLYEMLAGHRAFTGDTAVSVLGRVLHVDPLPLSRVLPDADPRLDEIISGCLRKEPERRFASMTEVRTRLQQIRRHRPVRKWLAAARWSLPALVTLAAVALVTVAALRLLNKPAAVGPATTTLSRITSDTGLTGYPAISPDGKLIVYSSDRGSGNLDLWVQQVGGSDPIRLTSDPADDYQASFSPDGTRVVFRSERNGGGVYIVSAFGGSERLLAPECRDPKFSPDGQWVACWKGVVGGSYPAGFAQVLIVPASGGEPRTFRPDFQASAYPLWTKDGRGLLFLGRKGGPPGAKAVIDWWAASIDGSAARATGVLERLKDAGIAPPPGAFWIRPENWVRKDDQVLFTALHGDATNIWQLAVDNSGKVSGAPARVTLGTSFNTSPSVAETGQQAATAFASLAIEVGVWTLPLTRQGTAAGDAELIVSGQPGISSPSISADGQRIAFASTQASGNRILFWDRGTPEQHLVSAMQSTRAARPVISADGSTLAFANGFVGYRTLLPNGVPELICANCGPPTHVSSDGSEVLFEPIGFDGRLPLWSRGQMHRLILRSDPQGPDPYGGSFSPDGKWVVFHLADHGLQRIFVVPNSPDRVIGQNEWIPISGESTADYEARWAPDGNRIYFLSDRDGFRCIWARPVNPVSAWPTGPAYAVAHFHHARRALSTMRPTTGDIGLYVSRDALVFALTDMTGNVWLQTGKAN